MIIAGNAHEIVPTGHYIVTPLVGPNGTTVLVDRGFVLKSGFE